MKKLIICIPGKDTINETMKSLIALLFSLSMESWSVQIRTGPFVNIFEARNSLLGFPPLDDYDYILWIDSDVIFTPDDFKTLLGRDKDIVSGVYRNADESICAVISETNDRKDYRFLNTLDLENEDLILVNWCGLGFMLVKKGVFEAIGYPWFKQVPIKNHEFDDMSAEDEGFGIRVREKGFEIWLDPSVQLGHKKTHILK